MAEGKRYGEHPVIPPPASHPATSTLTDPRPACVFASQQLGRQPLTSWLFIPNTPVCVPRERGAVLNPGKHSTDTSLHSTTRDPLLSVDSIMSSSHFPFLTWVMPRSRGCSQLPCLSVSFHLEHSLSLGLFRHGHFRRKHQDLTAVFIVGFWARRACLDRTGLYRHRVQPQPRPSGCGHTMFITNAMCHVKG